MPAACTVCEKSGRDLEIAVEAQRVGVWILGICKACHETLATAKAARDAQPA